MSLTEGVLGALDRGEQHSEFNVQVLAVNPVGSGEERFRIVISDGVYQNNFSMLATHLNPKIYQKEVDNYAIIKVKKHVYNKAASGMKVLLLMDIDIVKPGSKVGHKIGNPESLPNDESAAPQRTGNKNQDPKPGADQATTRMSVESVGWHKAGPGPGSVPGDGEEGEVGHLGDTVVQINIKSPVASFQDIRLECPIHWTVNYLKQKIFDRLQVKISPKKQRLVYAGRILDDNELLKHIIRFQDECSVYTILLVSPEPYKAPSTSPPAASNSENKTELRRRRQEPRTLPSQESNPGSSSHLEMNSWASEYLQLSNQLQGSQEPAQQMAALQEMYSQYLVQYMQYIQTTTSTEQYIQAGVPQSYFQSLSPETTTSEPGTSTAAPGGGGGRSNGVTGGAGLPRHDDPVQAAAVAAVVRPPQQQQQPAAGVEPAADVGIAGERQRDALDWVYSCVRVLFLVSLVYFYSSLPRFLLVLGIFLAFQYFQREGNQQERLNIQEQVNNIRDNNMVVRDNNMVVRDNNMVVRDNNMDNDQTQGLQEGDREVEGEAEPGWRWRDHQPGDLEQDGEQEQQEVEEENPDILTTVSTFILSFFTSLLPEPTNQLID